jgi:hypothetical protein
MQLTFFTLVAAAIWLLSIYATLRATTATTVDATTSGGSWEDPVCEALRYECMAHDSKLSYVLLCTCAVSVRDIDDAITVELWTSRKPPSKVSALPRLSVNVSGGS